MSKGYDATMKIAVIGTGYVGLVTGVCFSEVGNDVTCIDIDALKIKQMKAGEIPIYEPGLGELLRDNQTRGRLHFTTDMPNGIKDAEVIFLALPTPPGADGSADLSAVLSVASQLSNHLGDNYAVIINKSTVPVGTADRVRAAIAANHSGNFDVVSNPEFLREGAAVHDFMEPDRVVIGTHSDKARAVMQELYAPLVNDQRPLLFMDEYSAELCKYAANAFLATKISFINEIANVADRVGADVEAVARAIGADGRIGSRFLQAGIGYGGSCFPKDVQALAKTAESVGYDFKIIDAVLQANAVQRHIFVDKIRTFYDGNLAGKHFAVWGLAFKPDTDDIREAPSLTIIDELLAAGATVTAFDPEAMENVERFYADKSKQPLLAETPLEAVKDADALLVVTEWKVFRNTELSQLKQALKAPAVFDGRNIFDPHAMRDAGFIYESVGRP
jgi:UDPglucose 6-dehydrogenase